jgi:hypothetical protein
MRIPGAGRLAVLGLGVAVAVAGAQSTGKYKAKPTEATSGWWKGWFGSKDEAKKPAGPPPGPTVADKHAELDRLMKAYWRRQEVCDRLRDIALQASDDKLYEEAGRLEDMAWRLHQARSSKLFGVPVAAADDDPPEEPEESTLDVLKRAAPGGALPPRLRNGGKMEPATANRAERKREEE